jgi:hypothetical protein
MPYETPRMVIVQARYIFILAGYVYYCSVRMNDLAAARKTPVRKSRRRVDDARR